MLTHSVLLISHKPTCPNFISQTFNTDILESKTDNTILKQVNDLYEKCAWMLNIMFYLLELPQIKLV